MSVNTMLRGNGISSDLSEAAVAAHQPGKGSKTISEPSLFIIFKFIYLNAILFTRRSCIFWWKKVDIFLFNRKCCHFVI